jgi:acyl-CoA reductase-like NAD-dependent aldehyde dehydrogenase
LRKNRQAAQPVLEKRNEKVPEIHPMTSPTIAVRNPYTGQMDYAFTPANAPMLRATAQRLRAAQPAWAALPLAERVAVLRRFAAVAESQKEALAERLAADTGRWALSLSEASLGPKIERDIATAEQVLARVETAQSHGPLVSEAQFVPYALVANITPWNFPVSLAFLDTVLPLLAGAAVIVKPSEITPRFIDVIERLLRHVPELESVLAFVRGGAAQGQQLIELADYVCFTGSVATGRKIYESAARAFIPCSLELGGKDPMIVLEDADIESAAVAAVIGGCLASGQICTSIERIYVAAPIYESFVEAVVEKAKRLPLNLPDMKSGFIGPFIYERQATIVGEHIEQAKAAGARVLSGGEIVEHGGLWCPATVLTGVDHTMAVMREETFGPVLPIMPFASEAEAVVLANDSRYGLAGLVYGGDLERARAVARQVRAGGVGVNRAGVTVAARGFEQDAFGFSGAGRSRMGAEGLLRFYRRQAIIAYTGDDREATSAMANAVFGR